MAMAMNATKFTFDTVFADSRDVVGESARARRRRSLTESEIEGLCAEAKAQGTKAAEVVALEAVAHAAGETTRALKDALAQLAKEREFLLGQSAQLAFALARKLAGAALAEFPQAEVETALREAMHQALGEPRIVLRVAPDVADALASRLADIAHQEGYDGKVQITADPSLRRADCRVEWRGGGAERAEAAIEKSLEELIARSFPRGAMNDEGAVHGKQ